MTCGIRDIKFSDSLGQEFILEVDTWADNAINALYSNHHDMYADLVDVGMGHYDAIWPNECHNDMRIIPALGRDGIKMWIIHVYEPSQIVVFAD